MNLKEVKGALESPHGKQILEYLVDYCGVYKDVFAPDALAISRNDGVRSVAIHLINLLAIPDEQLTREEINKRKFKWTEVMKHNQ